VWPRVVAAVPAARLLVVGRDPPPSVLRLAGPGIEVTGTVPDVTPYYRRARVAVVPLRAGGGSRLKLLEALDAGRPVVATPIGAEGFDDLTGEGVVLADDPEAYATSVIRLLTDAAGAAELGLRGHAAVRRRHSWDAAYEPLLDAVAAGSPAATYA
jgi:glycosyltransferase involved in cell wall biosynthesis